SAAAYRLWACSLGHDVINTLGVQLTCGDERSELIFRSLSFAREANAFVKADDGAAVVAAGKRSARVDIVACECAANVATRVRAPCVLVTRKSASGASFHYSLLALSGSGRLETCVQFKLPYEMRENVSILRGPTVAWSHAGGVFHASPRTAEVRRTPLELSHCVIGELPAQVFDGSVIMPHQYVGITRCVLALSADKVDGVLKSAVVAATSNRQLVSFENGAVKEACQLPFDRPELIQLVNAGRHGCLFVVSFHQGHVCALWKDTFQIASRWSGVTSVHVEDFLGCGTDQMLLVFEDGGVTEQPMRRFLLTDLCGISYSRGQDSGAPRTPPPPPENDLLTLRALESRLQSGLTVLQELRAEMRVKDRVLQQSIRALTDAVSEEKTPLTRHEQSQMPATRAVLFDTYVIVVFFLCPDDTEEDFLSLMALRDQRVFRIHSPDHSLDDIDGWIQKIAGCRRIEVSPQYLLLNSSGPSALMLLHWHQMSPFQGELSVHSSQLQALQLLDSLLAHLPACCSIQSVKGTRGQGAAQILSLALEKELVSLRDGVSLLLCEEEEEEKEEEKKSLGHGETPQPGSVEELQRRREAFQGDVERSKTRLSPLVDVGRYRELTRRMSKVQLDTDLAAFLNTNNFV
uniref:FA complementation group B n=1 Tax=Gasterosteus aculeatus aculeatus TaxID=481459 RepID=A0AAQ4NQ19_GASAC